MYVSILILMLLIVLSNKKFKESIYIYILLLIFIAIIFSVIKETIGTDSQTYKDIFENSLEKRNSIFTIRSGFLLEEMMRLIRRFTDSYFVFRVIVINLILFLFWDSINKIFKKEERVYIYVLFFSSGILLNYSLNGLKQGLAMGVYYLAITSKNRVIRYLLYMLGILFHNLLIVPIILGRVITKLSNKKILLIFVVTIFLGTSIENIILFIMRYEPSMGYFLQYFEKNAFGVRYNFFNLLEYQIAFIIVYLIDIRKKSEQNNYIKMFYLQVILVNLLINQKVAATRMASFFCLYQFYAYYFVLNKLIKSSLIKNILFVVICIVFFLVRVNSWEYYTIWH